MICGRVLAVLAMGKGLFGR